MNNKKGLGRGLEELLSVFDEENDEQEVETYSSQTKSQKSTSGVMEIALDEIVANPNQPRKIFNEEALNELAQSIKMHGVIQPIVVNERDDGKYLIIAGERRWRASKIAGMESIPAIVKRYTEKQVKELSLIENLQREDLNPVEAARAIKQLMEEYKFTQEMVADRIGKSRPAIANTLRLLSLPQDILAMVEENRLSAGHARCLVAVSDANVQYKFATMSADNKMSVRDLEKQIRNYLSPKPAKIKERVEQSIELKELVNEMQRAFSTKVSVIGNDHKGRIYIDYYSRDDLDRICDILELIKKQKLTLQDLQNFNKYNK
ncbi:MAG: ParB/RepB/Spo0J family partition protein [Christensenellales bacterium]